MGSATGSAGDGRRTGPFVLGVTGGIGSGKSTVCGLLAARGARVFDADRIVRALYAGGDLVARIAARFGAGVVAADGSVDRAALGALVFDSPAARRDLEALVHPAVRATILDGLADLAAEGFPGLAVIDAALLIEAASPYPLDALWVVTAPRDVRLARLEARGVPRAEAERRIAAQASDDAKVARADREIPNGGSLRELEAVVDRALGELGIAPAGPDPRAAGTAGAGSPGAVFPVDSPGSGPDERTEGGER